MGSFVKALSTMIKQKEDEVNALESENSKHQDRINALLSQIKEVSKSPKVTNLISNLETEFNNSNASNITSRSLEEYITRMTNITNHPRRVVVRKDSKSKI